MLIATILLLPGYMVRRKRAIQTLIFNLNRLHHAWGDRDALEHYDESCRLMFWFLINPRDFGVSGKYHLYRVAIMSLRLSIEKAKGDSEVITILEHKLKILESRLQPHGYRTITTNPA